MRHLSPLSLISTLVIALTGLAGYFLTRTVSPVADTPSVSSEAMTSIQKLEQLPDRTLSGFKKTGVTDIQGPYKRVVVDNNALHFSFEVPDEWLVELRNSGELPMNEEEMRSFFGDYWDFTEEQLLGENIEDLRVLKDNRADEYSPGFPQVSIAADVSSRKNIWYSDVNVSQIDFFVFSDEQLDRYLRKGKYFLNFGTISSDADYKNENINYRRMDFEYSALEKISGGTIINVLNNSKNKNLIILKQGIITQETEFGHLVDTLIVE